MYYYYRKFPCSVNQTKTLPTAQSNVEGGKKHTPTLLRMFQNRAGIGGSKKTQSVVGTDTVFQNPAYGNDNAPAITRLDGNTEPITKSGITRISNETGLLS